MYDPSTGDFIQEDPTEFDGGDTNLGRFCANSPTNATDPSGEALVWGSQSDFGMPDVRWGESFDLPTYKFGSVGIKNPGSGGPSDEIPVFTPNSPELQATFDKWDRDRDAAAHAFDEFYKSMAQLGLPVPPVDLQPSSQAGNANPINEELFQTPANWNPQPLPPIPAIPDPPANPLALDPNIFQLQPARPTDLTDSLLFDSEAQLHGLGWLGDQGSNYINGKARAMTAYDPNTESILNGPSFLYGRNVPPPAPPWSDARWSFPLPFTIFKRVKFRVSVGNPDFGPTDVSGQATHPMGAFQFEYTQ